MTSPAVVIGPDATLGEACDLMAREHLHHLPVVDAGRLVGIVSTTGNPPIFSSRQKWR